MPPVSPIKSGLSTFPLNISNSTNNSLTLGRKELLQWTAELTGRPLTTYDDLRTGGVILYLLHAVLPGVADSTVMDKVRDPTRTEADVRQNWALIGNALRSLKIPLSLSTGPEKRSRHRLCYQLLVTMYFLNSLRSRHDFAVELAEAVDADLAAFLQSPDSVQCVAKGAHGPQGGNNNTTMNSLEVTPPPHTGAQSLGRGSTDPMSGGGGGGGNTFLSPNAATLPRHRTPPHQNQQQQQPHQQNRSGAGKSTSSPGRGGLGGIAREDVLRKHGLLNLTETSLSVSQPNASTNANAQYPLTWSDDAARRVGESTLLRLRGAIQMMESQVVLLQEEMTLTEEKSQRLCGRAIQTHDAMMHWESACLHHVRCDTQFRWDALRDQDQLKFEQEINRIVNEQDKILQKETPAFRSRVRAVMDDVVEQCLRESLTRLKSQEQQYLDMIAEEQKHAEALQQCWEKMILSGASVSGGNTNLSLTADVSEIALRMALQEANCDLMLQRVRHAREIERLRHNRNYAGERSSSGIGSFAPETLSEEVLDMELQNANSLRTYLIQKQKLSSTDSSSMEESDRNLSEFWNLVLKIDAGYEALVKMVEQIEITKGIAGTSPQRYLARIVEDIKSQRTAHFNVEVATLDAKLTQQSIAQLREVISRCSSIVAGGGSALNYSSSSLIRECTKRLQRSSSMLQMRESIWNEAIQKQRRYVSSLESDASSSLSPQMKQLVQEAQRIQKALAQNVIVGRPQSEGFEPHVMEVVRQRYDLLQKGFQDTLQPMINELTRVEMLRKSNVLETHSAQHAIEVEKTLHSHIQQLTQSVTGVDKKQQQTQPSSDHPQRLFTFRHQATPAGSGSGNMMSTSQPYSTYSSVSSTSASVADKIAEVRKAVSAVLLK